MGTTWARLGLVSTPRHAGSRIVLDNEVLPIGKPDGTIGTDFCADRRHPFIAAGHKIKSILGNVSGPIRLHVHQGDELHGGLTHHGFSLQTRGQVRGVDKAAASCGRISAEDVHLSVVGGDGMCFFLKIDLLGRHPFHACRINRGRDATVENGGTIGGAAEIVTGGIGTLSPRIIGKLM